MVMLDAFAPPPLTPAERFNLTIEKIKRKKLFGFTVGIDHRGDWSRQQIVEHQIVERHGNFYVQSTDRPKETDTRIEEGMEISIQLIGYVDNLNVLRLTLVKGKLVITQEPDYSLIENVTYQGRILYAFHRSVLWNAFPFREAVYYNYSGRAIDMNETDYNNENDLLEFMKGVSEIVAYDNYGCVKYWLKATERGVFKSEIK